MPHLPSGGVKLFSFVLVRNTYSLALYLYKKWVDIGITEDGIEYGLEEWVFYRSEGGDLWQFEWHIKSGSKCNSKHQ